MARLASMTRVTSIWSRWYISLRARITSTGSSRFCISSGRWTSGIAVAWCMARSSY